MLKVSRNILAVASLIVSSCAAPRYLPIESVKDSVEVVIVEKVTYKDSLIYVEVPVESHSAVVEVTDTSFLETSIAESTAWYDGRLNHTLRHKPDTRIAKIVNIPTYARSEEVKSLAQMVVVKEVEKKLTKWQLFRMTLGSVLIIGLFIWLVRKAVKLLV